MSLAPWHLFLPSRGLLLATVYYGAAKPGCMDFVMLELNLLSVFMTPLKYFDIA